MQKYRAGIDPDKSSIGSVAAVQVAAVPELGVHNKYKVRFHTMFQQTAEANRFEEGSGFVQAGTHSGKKNRHFFLIGLANKFLNI